MKLSLLWVCLNEFNFHSLFSLWTTEILNDFETIWDRFNSVDLNRTICAKCWLESHPQTLHSMEVTQTFRNFFIHQSSGYAELCLLCSLSLGRKWKIVVALFFTEILISCVIPHFTLCSSLNLIEIKPIQKWALDHVPIHNQWSNLVGYNESALMSKEFNIVGWNSLVFVLRKH